MTKKHHKSLVLSVQSSTTLKLESPLIFYLGEEMVRIACLECEVLALPAQDRWSINVKIRGNAFPHSFTNGSPVTKNYGPASRVSNKELPSLWHKLEEHEVTFKLEKTCTGWMAVMHINWSGRQFSRDPTNASVYMCDFGLWPRWDQASKLCQQNLQISLKSLL